MPVAQADGPAWSSLTPGQQSALAPLKSEWHGIDATRKQKWLDIAARFPSMPADERERLQERMTQWVRMTPDERGRTRLQYQEVRKIKPQDRQTRWDDYMALPMEARQALSQYATTVPKSPPAAQPGVADSNAKTAKERARQAGAEKTTVPQPALKPVAPTFVQVRPGATTTLISNTPPPPAQTKAGQPMIDAGTDAVDRRTLLPQVGGQGVAAGKPPAQAKSR